MRLIDANLIIRYLTLDNPAQAKAAGKLLKGSKVRLVIADVTIAEIIWVLTSIYKYPKQKITSSIRSMLKLKTLKINGGLLNRALSFYEENNISFIDAYLASYSIEQKLDGIYSYDKGLDKIKSIKRFEP